MEETGNQQTSSHGYVPVGASGETTVDQTWNQWRTGADTSEAVDPLQTQDPRAGAPAGPAGAADQPCGWHGVFDDYNPAYASTQSSCFSGVDVYATAGTFGIRGYFTADLGSSLRHLRYQPLQ